MPPGERLCFVSPLAGLRHEVESRARRHRSESHAIGCVVKYRLCEHVMESRRSRHARASRRWRHASESLPRCHAIASQLRRHVRESHRHRHALASQRWRHAREFQFRRHAHPTPHSMKRNPVLTFQSRRSLITVAIGLCKLFDDTRIVQWHLRRVRRHLFLSFVALVRQRRVFGVLMESETRRTVLCR